MAELKVKIGIDVGTYDARVCAQILEYWLNGHEGRDICITRCEKNGEIRTAIALTAEKDSGDADASD